ncbi:hypothetical protein HK104_010441 [Borealophlyctis nickersoniae]|nr:hypothetical protein HK104_010441 [Borealophlyctis nickersoniae]
MTVSNPRHTAPASFQRSSVYAGFYSRMLGVALAASAIVAGVEAQGTNPAPLSTNLQSCVPDGQFNAAGSVDYFPEKSTIPSTAPFKITYHGYYKTITSTAGNQTIVLYQCGTQRPADVQADKFIAVPITSVYAGDTTVIPYIEALGGRETITLSDSTQYITSPCLHALNRTQNLDAANATHALEQTSGASVAFGFVGAKNANASNFVAFPATLSNAMNRAQWLQFVAAFYNKEALATTLTQKITNNYGCISSAAKQSQPSTGGPVVAFTNYLNYQNKETWQITSSAYINDYITDSGARNLSGVTVFSYTEKSKFLEALKSVDILMDNTLSVSSITDLYKAYGLTKDSTDYKFVKNGQIYTPNRQQNANGGSQWFESAVLLQNVVLADFVWMTNPKLQKDYVPTFIQKLDGGNPTILTAANCPNAAAPLEIPDVKCPAAIKPEEGGSAGGASNGAEKVVGVKGVVAVVVAALGAMMAL